MKRFLKIFSLLIVSLFLLVSGVDKAMDQLSRSVDQGSYTFYDANGVVVVDYSGDLRLCKTYARPVSVTPPTILHRT